MSLKILFSFFFFFVFLACESDHEHTNSKKSQSAQEKIENKYPYLIEEYKAKISKKWKIAYVPNNETSLHWNKIQNGIKEEADKYGIELTFANQQKSSRKSFEQIKTIEDLLQSKVDGIIISPIDSQAVALFLEQSKITKPIIIQNTIINSQKPITQITSDNYEAGLKLGKWLVKRLKNKAKVVILEGSNNNLNSALRRNGLINGLAYGNIEILSIKDASNSKSKAKAITTQWLETFTDIDAIITLSDDLALGVLDAITNQKNIIVTGFGASEEGLKAVENEQLTVTVNQEADLQTKAAIRLMIRYLENNETFEKFSVWKNISLIDKSNILKYLEKK